MKKLMLLLICVMLFFCSCGYSNTQMTEPPAATEAEVFSVAFAVQGSVFSRQNLTEGEVPKQFDVYLADAEVAGWSNQYGELVDPFVLPVDGDITYYAVVRPALSKHDPYLFANSEGLLCPENPLTEMDLSQALKSLATDEALVYFPQLHESDNAVTREVLIAQLGYFFDETQVQEVFTQSQSINRREFARGMNQLLGRGESEQFTVLDENMVPIDVVVDGMPDEDLLEAAVSHIPSKEGLTWSQFELPFAYEPGFVNVDGWLYYVKEDGQLLKDGNYGTLYFGPDGRYSSSDAELDKMVADILREMIANNPNADRFELLRVIFDYCHQSFTYRRINSGNPAYGATGWEIDIAKDMFTTSKGNCYSFAATFWALARGIGYEPRAISGQCLSDRQPHSWCILELDGEDYIFDPQWQYSYTQRGVFEYDMFMISLERGTFWLYRWVK